MKHFVRWPIQVWLAGGMVIVIVVASLLVLQGATINAAPESNVPLDCLSCHTRVLRGHDTLGSGNEACWVCHDSVNIGKLSLLDGTQLLLADSTPLCKQCHLAYYDAWQGGGHGTYNAAGRMKCVDCHNPHQPQMEIAVLAKPEPAAEEEGLLDCLACHVRVLKGHDKLGSGNDACWACHHNMEMGVLHLAGGQERLPLTDYPELCAQCHQRRYEDWVEGTHGAPAWQEGIVEVHGAGKVGCIGCHDPHQPQVILSGITKTHPAPRPPSPPPPVTLLAVAGISFLLVIAVGVVVLKKGEWPWSG